MGRLRARLSAGLFRRLAGLSLATLFCSVPWCAGATDGPLISKSEAIEHFYRHWAEVSRAQRSHPIRTSAEYRRFLASVDLDSDEGLMTWAVHTQIPVVAVSSTLTTLLENRQLVHTRCDGELALQLDGSSASIACLDESGQATRNESIPSEWIVTIRSAGQCRVLSRRFAEPNLDALKDYLVLPSDVDRRHGISNGIAALPFSMVKVLAGKTIWLS